MYKTSSLTTRMNEISRNLVNYFKAAPQITLYNLQCNLMIVLPKPKHVATLLKQSNFSNYTVVMSHCLSLFIFPRLTIYCAVHLTNAICHVMLKRFVNVSRRFESLQSHHLLGQSVKKLCTLQRLKPLGSPLSKPKTSLSLTNIRPAPSSVLFGPSPYRMFNQKLYCPQ
jgi:hypothetical protein